MNKTLQRSIFLFVLLINIITISTGQIYVNSNSTGSNNGTSWNDAYVNLSVALQNASAGEEVWVATGTYLPTTCSTCSTIDRDQTFVVPSGVKVLGGFPNTGNPILVNRNWQNFPTVLSGDIDTDGILTNNSYTVVTIQNANNQTGLDGFIIQDGNAVDGTFILGRSYGGGILNYANIGASSFIEIKNCTFQNNAAIYGGAIANFGNSIGSSTDITINNTQFINNKSTSQGGAINNGSSQNSSHTGFYSDCVFSGNTAGRDGGAIFNNASGSGTVNLEIEECEFLSNRATNGTGGGIYHISNGNGTISCNILASRFDDNRCGMYGGAIASISSDGDSMTGVIGNSIFTDNFSMAGGAIYALGSNRGITDYTIVNSVFFSNNATIGGAIYFNEQNFNPSTSAATVKGSYYNSIFKNNTSINFDPLFHFSGTPEMSLQNCLMFDVQNCNDKVLGAGDADCLGGMIYGQDPLFVDEGTGDFRLSPQSPAINTGNNTLLPAILTTDIEGNPRIASGVVDIGAYERTSTIADSDNDGITDAADNCPTIANVNQSDADNDGAGTVCDCDESAATGANCSSGCSTFYRDQDGDGFGIASTSITACIAPAGYVANSFDCDDSDATIYTNAPELCDGKDNNCNGQSDEGTDNDNDGVCNENDICPNGDDTIDLNNNGTPDACESALSFTCPNDITVTANAGQAQVTVNWQEPTATTNCTTGVGNTGGNCTATTLAGLDYIGNNNGHNYYLSQNQKIWTQAQAEAASLQGYLVVIDDAGENQFIKDAIGNKIIHIGLEYDPTTNTSSWVNGEALNYDNRQANSNSSAVNRYGILYFWNGQWDYHGDYTKSYIIEIPCSGGDGNGSSQIQQTSGLTNGANFPIGTTPITYQATDDCEGATTCSFTITVEAMASNISLTCPANVTATALPGATQAIATWTAPIPQTDCTAGMPTTMITSGQAIGDSFPIGATTVIYESTDDCGGSTSCSFEVTVSSGNSNLSLTCPTDINETTLPGATSATATWIDPIPQTDCTIGTPTLTVTTGHASGDLFPTGTTVVTYEATDGCNSVTNCSFNVTVTGVDNTLAVTCPNDIVVNAAVGATSANANWSPLIPTSNCPIAPTLVLMTPIVNGGAFPLGNSTVTYEAVDACGGFNTCSFQVMVNPTSGGDLVLTCPQNATVSVSQGASSGRVSWLAPMATTTCVTGGSTGGVACTSDPINGFQYLGELDGHIYYMSNNALPWPQAKVASENAGGRLVVIESAAENDFIFSQISDVTHIGLSDSKAEGTFTWVDGSALSFDNSQSFTPNSPSNNFVVMYNWQPGKWGYVNANVWKKFIVEIPCGGSRPTININQTSGSNSGSTFPIGQTQVSYQASDECSNTATCSFTIEVIEQTLTCVEDRDGGTIGGDETNCDPYTPTPITNSSLPSGGEGTIEYIWLASINDCPTSIGEQIPGEQGASLMVGFLSQTTTFVRWSRREGCIDWVASNCITKTVETCGGPPSTNYCTTNGQQPWQEWIAEVNLESINNPSGKSSLGYDDFTNTSTSLTGGQTYEVQVRAGFSYTQWDENMYVWIDFNQDNDFTDAGELVLNKVSPIGTPLSIPPLITASFLVPTTAINGTTRMRVAMKRSSTTDPCETFLQGEVEDYSIIIGGATDRSLKKEILEEPSYFKVYPNPSTDYIHLYFEEDLVEGSSVQVINLFGQILDIYYPKESRSLKISLENFSSGLYYINFSTPNGPLNSKNFIVDKGY